MNGPYAIIPIAVAFVGLWTIFHWLYRGAIRLVGWVVNRPPSRTDQRIMSLEARVAGIEDSVGKIAVMIETMAALPPAKSAPELD